METATKTPSRRALLRGKFGAPPKGKNWVTVENLSAGSGDVFWSGWADEESVFITGDNGKIFHFDGSDWTSQHTPAPVPVHGIWGPNREELWAIGWMGMVLRFRDNQWELVHGCQIDESEKYAKTDENTPLFDIHGFEDGRLWAVGDNGRILHFDGQIWQGEASPVRTHLRSVRALQNGTVIAAGGDGTVLLRSQKGAWEVLECPIRSNYVAALELEDGQVLLAGGRYFIDAGGFRGDLILWDGEHFQKLFDGASFSRFRDLLIYKEGVLTVGDGGQIHTISKGQIKRIESGVPHDLLGAFALPNGEAIAVGDFGTVLAGEAQALAEFSPYIAVGEAQAVWEKMPSGTDRQLWGAWYDEAQGLYYACGEEGVVLALDRGKWERLPACGTLGIHALGRASDGGLLAVGQLGEIHHFDGKAWRKEFDLHMDITLLSLYCDGAGKMIAAGDEGLALSFQDGHWQRMTTGTRSALYGLWGYDADHLLAVGDFGLILRWNGKSWDEFSAQTEQFLFDVWGRALDDVYFVGLSGTIGHFDGQRWSIMHARAREDLLAISGNEEAVIAVGAAGTAIINNANEAQWRGLPTGVNIGLRDIAAGGDKRFIAVGDGGTIIRYDYPEKART